MIRLRTYAGRWVAAATLALGLTSSAQEVKRIVLPEGVFYYQPAAAVFGAEAAWINPAGLGRYNVTSAQVMADQQDGHYAKSWGWLASRDQLAIAWRTIDNGSSTSYKEFVYAAGAATRQLSVGASYRYFDEGPDYFNNRHFWNIGLQHQGTGPVSWGAVFSNLNRGKVNGLRTETEQRYSLSFRFPGDKITVSADMFLSTKMRLPNADYVYHAEVAPVPGLSINGFVDSHRNFEIGVRANLVRYFVGARGRYSRHGSTRGYTTFAGYTNLRQPSLIREPAKRLALRVSGDVSENPPRPVFGRSPLPFVTVLTSIYRAADDPSVRELIITLDAAGFGLARAQELREALTYFEGRGKRLICYLANPNNLSYYIASISDSILIPPVSQLNLVGLRAELTFWAGTLDKLGVKVDLMRIGEYKTAAETYTRSAASAENQQQLNRILDDLYSQFVGGIAKSRGISEDSVRRIIDNGPYTSTDALKFGLVSGLCYEDELGEHLTRVPQQSLRRYVADTLINYSWRRPEKIAVVTAEGDITDGKSSESWTGSSEHVTPSEMSRAFADSFRDPSVKAIVVRIDSPGGLALASDAIAHAATKRGDRRPLVVSMGNVAASGGYYIAMPGRRLFANPATITGSIGIFGGKADLSGLYQKLALGKELYVRGRFAGMLTMIRPFSDEERQKYFDQLKAFYDHFVDLVSANRSISHDSVDALGRGQVWTGREAKSNGLVDELGGLKSALDYSAHQAGLKAYDISVYPVRRPLLLLPGWRSLSAAANLFARAHPSSSGDLLSSLSSLSQGAIYARLPYDLKIE